MYDSDLSVKSILILEPCRYDILKKLNFWISARAHTNIHTTSINTHTHYNFEIIHRFPGHLNDINCFNIMPSLGPGCDLPLSAGCHILADGGYPPHPVLVRPRKKNQVRGNRRLQKINKELRRYRVKVEHEMSLLKTYRCISEEGGRWRHKKSFLSIVIHVCACLSNRRKRFLAD